MLVIIFWTILALISWTYVGYPLLLRLMLVFVSDDKQRESIEPSCTMVIAAYNEEKSIAQKLENCLQLDYPRDRLQIIVASDCSDDGTHEIVREFSGQGVELLVLDTRGGKTAAQNKAVQKATGDIIIFTDASTEFSSDTIKSIVRPFADSKVGAVGAELEYVSDRQTHVGQGAGAYWRYERWVKKMESSVNSLIGVSGCLYAVRKGLYSPISPDMISDFVIASEVYKQQHVTVYSSGTVSREKTLEDAGQEFDMRVRVAIRSINALIRYARMLNPLKYGFFAVQLLSHKVLRYLVPELLLLLIPVHAAIVLSKSSPEFYSFLLIPHGAIYILAILGWVAQSFAVRISGLHIPFYFMHVNLSALWALILYIGGERKTIWTPIR